MKYIIHKKKLIKTGNGFTIIELLITVAIIVVLIAVTIPGFYKFKLNLSLSRVAYKFEQDLRRMQAKSLTSPLFEDGNGDTHKVGGYGIYVDISNNKEYVIYADRFPGNKYYEGGSPSCAQGLDCIVENFDFSITEPGIIIKQINNITGNNVSINFNPSGPTTTITPLANQNKVDVVFAIESDLTKIRTVSVNTAGLVEVE